MYVEPITCLLTTTRAKSHEEFTTLGGWRPAKCSQTLTFQRQSKDFLVVIGAWLTHSVCSMAEPDRQLSHPPARPRYRWPLFVLAAFVLAILLAVLWLSFEVRRTARIRQLNSPGGQFSP